MRCLLLVSLPSSLFALHSMIKHSSTGFRNPAVLERVDVFIFSYFSLQLCSRNRHRCIQNVIRYWIDILIEIIVLKICTNLFRMFCISRKLVKLTLNRTEKINNFNLVFIENIPCSSPSF